MEALLWLLYLAALVVLAVVLRKLFGKDGGSVTAEEPPAGQSCATCSSEPGRCLQECAMEAAVAEIEYFDDEELDRFRGRRADGYTDEEAGEFAEVMYTMRPEEVKDWLRSLRLRGVSLPDQLKDEAYMLAEG